MSRRVAVATVTRDRVLGKRRRWIFVERALDEQGLAGVAQQALLAHGADKIWGAVLFVSGRHVIALESRVIANRRLEQMVADPDEIPGGVVARPDHVSDPIFGEVSIALHALPQALLVGVDREFRTRVGMFKCALRFLARTPQGTRHGRVRIALRLLRVAGRATIMGTRVSD